MSPGNGQRASQAFDALNRRDFAAFLALMDGQVQAESRIAAMEGGYQGHDGVRRWWENLLGVFPDFAIDPIEVRELGDMTVAELRNRAHGGESATPLEETIWHVAQWRAEKVVWWSAYATEQEALEAMELRARRSER